MANGLYPRYCPEDLKWFSLEEFVAYPMACFCDIPLSRINEHTTFYGKYGIGFTKEWGLKNGLQPVIYCPEGSMVKDVANYLLHSSPKKAEAEAEAAKTDGREMENAFWSLTKLVKPLKGTMRVSGELVEKDFYKESEWRYTPKDRIWETAIFEDEFEEKKDRMNKIVENFKLEINPNDIKYIFIASDSDIPRIVDFIETKMGKFPHNDIKVLNTRIISLDTIEKDL
ncbi:MAG: hypothetical protein JJT88_20640 [Gammaproteobacteria bacterium]|nr:hypothetical protein [Gammaproteobacteria bacterium]